MKKTILLIDAGYLHPTLREEGMQGVPYLTQYAYPRLFA
jgi:hypothetical protein